MLVGKRTQSPYALHYFVRMGPLLLVIELGAGGAYNDPADTRRTVEEAFAAALARQFWTNPDSPVAPADFGAVPLAPEPVPVPVPRDLLDEAVAGARETHELC